MGDWCLLKSPGTNLIVCLLRTPWCFLKSCADCSTNSCSAFAEGEHATIKCLVLA